MSVKSFSLAILATIALASAQQANAQDLRPSTKEQIRIGKDASAEVRKQAKILPPTAAYVKTMRAIAAKLIAQIPDSEKKAKPWEYTFDVIDDKEVNAFALPGGPIFFYRGLVDTFTTEDQFAGVLAHEMAHVRHTHWASQYADNLKRRLGLSLLLELIGAGRTAADLVDVADTVAFTLPYSRKHESEADRSGFDLMVAAGYNPQGMVDTFRKFENLKRGQGAPEFISTHPDDKHRIRTLEDMIKKSGKTFPAQRPLSWAGKTKMGRAR